MINAWMALFWDARRKHFRPAGVYSTEAGALARLEELEAGTIQYVQIDSPIQCEF